MKIIFKRMNWIQEYKIENRNGEKVVTGHFSGSAGKFEVRYEGDGGNSDTYKIKLSEGQFECETGKPVEFTIIGCWEFNEVAELLQLVKKIG